MRRVDDRVVSCANVVNALRASLLCSNFFQLDGETLLVRRAIVADDLRARDQLTERPGNPQVHHYGRAGTRQGTQLAMELTSLVRPASWALAREISLGDEHDHSPEFLSPHLHGGVVAWADHRASIRTVCAWCAGHDRPAAVLVDVPIDDRESRLGSAACAPTCGPTRGPRIVGRVSDLALASFSTGSDSTACCGRRVFRRSSNQGFRSG